MNTPDKRQIARQARAAWYHSQLQRELARRRTQPHSALAPPTFDAGAVVDLADGTLHRDVIAANQGLAVHVPLWPIPVQQPGLFDVLELEWAGGEGDYELVEMLELEGPIDPGTFPRTLRIPAPLLRPDGAYRLRYRVTSWNNVAAVCAPVPIRCDTAPPLDGTPPLPPGLPTEPITDAYLDASPEGIAWTLPPYPGHETGDEVHVWYVGARPDDPGGVPFDRWPVTSLPMTLHVPRPQVEAVGDGGCHLAYRVLDKAGNTSLLCEWARLAVALGPLPAGLQLPEVPRAADGLVDLNDVLAGVSVQVPVFTQHKPTDRIRIRWGGTLLAEQPIGADPDFPLQFPVSHAVLRETYGDAEGAVQTPVAYQVLRGDLAFPDEPLGIVVNVDLSVAGPELPEWPDPVNPQLAPARVFGAVSNQENILTRDDGGADARLVFTLYDPLKAGEVVTFHWDGKAVATYTVLADDTPGAEREVALAWDHIAEAGNHPALPVFYRLRGPGSPNEQQSPTSHVAADAFTLTPPATVCQKTYNGILNCQSLDGEDNAVLVRVPDLSEWLQEGDTIELSWTPYVGRNYDIPLPEANKRETVTLNTADGFPPTGFDWRMQPYEVHTLPIFEHDPTFGNGRAHLQYTFTFENELIRSLREERTVAMRNSNDPCPLNL